MVTGGFCLCVLKIIIIERLIIINASLVSPLLSRHLFNLVLNSLGIIYNFLFFFAFGKNKVLKMHLVYFIRFEIGHFSKELWLLYFGVVHYHVVGVLTKKYRHLTIRSICYLYLFFIILEYFK